MYRTESRRVFASLVRLVRDFDLAEEALHEAFAAAVERWAVDGVPDNPRAWLVSTGRFKAVDALRRRGKFAALQPELAGRLSEVAAANAARAGEEIEDDRLRLVFACCHPAIDRTVQVPLTLREVCGLTTEEIAAAFLDRPRDDGPADRPGEGQDPRRRHPVRRPRRGRVAGAAGVGAGGDLPRVQRGLLRHGGRGARRGRTSPARPSAWGGWWSNSCPTRRRSACSR